MAMGVPDILYRNGSALRSDTLSSQNFFSEVRTSFPKIFLLSHWPEFAHMPFSVAIKQKQY